MSSEDARRAEILRGIDKSMPGIEVAPWLRPLASKAEGYNVRVIDVLDRETLLARAMADPNIMHLDKSVLEDVDFVGSATEIAALVPLVLHGTFDYVVSSHNFEHLPNPIKFLRGCAEILRPGGAVLMLVPDRRACFDYFRRPTAIADWLEAFFEDRRQPNLRQVFDARSGWSEHFQGPEGAHAFGMGASPGNVRVTGDLGEQFGAWRAGLADRAYQDVHCSVMTPASLELLLAETRHLGLIGLETESISETSGIEFVVRLRNPMTSSTSVDEDFAGVRSALLRRILAEYQEQSQGTGLAVPASPAWHRRLSRRARSLGRAIRGKPDR